MYIAYSPKQVLYGNKKCPGRCFVCAKEIGNWHVIYWSGNGTHDIAMHAECAQELAVKLLSDFSEYVQTDKEIQCQGRSAVLAVSRMRQKDDGSSGNVFGLHREQQDVIRQAGVLPADAFVWKPR